jgi:hypothetical protein
MGRKKNIPKRNRIIISEESSSSSSYRPDAKRQRFLDDDQKTTNILLASPNDPILKKIPLFVQAFQDSLERLKSQYERAKLQAKIDCNGWYRGYRKITGSRFEVKILSDLIENEFSHVIQTQELVAYAHRQALLDKRVQSLPETRVFSEWSIIVSEDCDAQPIHIDVPQNNYQFGLILSGKTNAKGTIVLKKNIGPNTTQELLNNVWTDAPESLKDVLLSNQTVNGRMQRLLNAYGPLLWPREILQTEMAGAESLASTKTLQCGDLICTTGGIPHAGPACDNFRMVMFAAVSPNRSSLYNVDGQYFAHTAILYAIQVLWDTVTDTRESQIYLFQKLAQTVKDYESGPIAHHQYFSPDFTMFMNEMSHLSTESSEELIQDFLQKVQSKSERELFQYRPSNVWEVERSTSFDNNFMIADYL